MREVDFRHARLDSVVFDSCDLRSADFDYSFHDRGQFYNNQLEQSTFRNAYAQKTYINEKDGMQADLSMIASHIHIIKGVVTCDVDTSRETSFFSEKPCLSDNFFREYFKKQALPKELHPLKDYFDTWSIRNKFQSIFSSAAQNNEYITALLVLALYNGIRKFDKELSIPHC